MTDTKIEFTETVIERIIVGVILVVLVLVGGFFLWKSQQPKTAVLTPQKLTNSGYTYHFKFNSGAIPLKLKDSDTNALKYNNEAVAVATLSQAAATSPLLTKCSQIAAGWTQAFTVKVSGSSQPVCTSNNDYAVYFKSGGLRHIFSVTYTKKQAVPDTASLKSIFSSITVTQ